MSNILFIGRFQPFHKGHLWVIQKILKESPKVLIGIGSSQYQNVKNNPFSMAERTLMIEQTLKEINIAKSRFQIYPIKDINNDVAWPAHVHECIKEPFSEVWSGRPIVQELFRKYNHVIVVPIERQFGISATVIRHKIAHDDQSWLKMVPKAVAKVLKKIDGMQRIKKMEKQEDASTTLDDGANSR